MPPYERQAEPSKGNFLSWDPGESKDLVILSEKGTKSAMHWVAGESKECVGEFCTLCAEGAKKTIRWTVVVGWERDELPWEMSNTTFFGLEDVAEMAGGLESLHVRVTRHGSGLNTRYSVLPITEREQAAETPREIELLARDIRALCKLADMDPKQELKLFLAEVRSDLAKADPSVQMQAFYEYIDKETKDLQTPDEPPPDEEQDIGRYF